MSTRRFYLFGFGALMLFDTSTHVFLKLTATQVGEFTMAAGYLREVAVTPWIYAAAAGYIGAFITWMTLLKHAPVGPAFAASHLEVVTVLVVSVPLFGEHLTAPQIVGAVCIVLGIVCLGTSEPTRRPT